MTPRGRISALQSSGQVDMPLACAQRYRIHMLARFTGHTLKRDDTLVGLFAGLASLRQLWLEDNPLACAPRYRVDVLACFLAPGGLLLDGRPPSRAELEAARLRGPVRLNI